MSTVTQSGSRGRCFPVGLRPPSKHLPRERTDTNIIKQYVNKQMYLKYTAKPYGTKIRGQLPLEIGVLFMERKVPFRGLGVKI
jgi:hypothetical protein